MCRCAHSRLSLHSAPGSQSEASVPVGHGPGCGGLSKFSWREQSSSGNHISIPADRQIEVLNEIRQDGKLEMLFPIPMCKDVWTSTRF